MAATAVTVRLLNEYAVAPTSAIRGGDDRPGLGVDLAEFVPAGEAVAVRARLYNAEPDGTTVVRVRVRPVSQPGQLRTPWRDYPLEYGDGRWTGGVEPLAPGTYEVRVEALNVPRVGLDPAVDHVEVVAE
jgi:hypothetical protein